jgi:hypothetical protein
MEDGHASNRKTVTRLDGKVCPSEVQCAPISTATTFAGPFGSSQPMSQAEGNWPGSFTSVSHAAERQNGYNARLDRR